MKSIKVGDDLFRFQIDYNELRIPEKHIGIVLGYPNGQMPGHIKDVFYEIRNQAGQHCAIKGGYRLLLSDVYLSSSAMVTIKDKQLHIGRIIAKQLKNADSAALFACTLGPQLENWSRTLLADGEAVKGYIVDVIGSELVEQSMDKID